MSATPVSRTFDDGLPARFPGAALQVDYSIQSLDALLAAPDTLAVFGFGDAAPRMDDPRYLRVALEPHGGGAPLEVWRGNAPVARGSEDGIAWAEDGALQFGALQLDEADGDGIEGVGETAYQRLLAFTAARGYPHLLRVWNYFDGITDGDGDAERYKRFCVGRARGLGDVAAGTLPAATAIGRPSGAPKRDSAHASQAGGLQVYWLASRTPGTPLENPRQLSAYRYPRVYGPQPPSFARALLPPGAMPLLLSGTAAIVGHESRHADCVATQLDETLANFDSLIAAARLQRPSLPARFGAGTRLKVYVRDRDELDAVAALLDARLGADVPRIVLHATVCRRELRVEIDGSHA